MKNQSKMKKLIITICIAIVFVGFTSCKSEEQKKAEQFFSEMLSNEFSNEDRYKPIKTTVKVAKSIPQNDKFCLMKADTMIYYHDKIKEIVALTEPFIDAQIITKDIVRDILRLNMYYSNYNRIRNELIEYISSMDTTKIIGWEISQDFETITYGKCQSIFIVDENFQKTFILDFSNIVEARSIIDMIINNKLSEFKIIPISK